MYNCTDCGHDNIDLVVDEDGDLVCENCGYVIEPPPSENDIIHTCVNCDHNNRNLEKDEDDDLVCQECGHVIPDPDEDTDVIHTCAHCSHDNINLERDEEGDFVCQECGNCIPEDTPDLKEVRFFCPTPINITNIAFFSSSSPVTFVMACLFFDSSFFFSLLIHSFAMLHIYLYS